MYCLSKCVCVVTALALASSMVLCAPAHLEESSQEKQGQGGVDIHHCQGWYHWDGHNCVHRTCPQDQYWNGRYCDKVTGEDRNCINGSYWNGNDCVYGDGYNCANGYYWDGRACQFGSEEGHPITFKKQSPIFADVQEEKFKT